ncbi:MAG: PAS domain S-box protein, partial [Bacteroidota bacterium]
MNDTPREKNAPRETLAQSLISPNPDDRVPNLKRLYEVLSDINHAIIRTRDQGTLFRTICSIATERGKFRLAWIGLANEETGMVDPVVSLGDAAAYMEGIQVSVRDVPEGRGPTGTAIREERTLICGDVLTDPRMLPWRDRAVRNGIRSVAAVPFHKDHHAAGALTVYSDQPGFFDEAERSLLEGIGADISYALENISLVADRTTAEEALRASEERYGSLFANMSEGYAYCKIIFDDGRPSDFVYLAVNPAFETLTGLSNVVGRRVSEVIPGIQDSNPELFDSYGRVAATGTPEQFETYLPTLDLWLSISVFSPARDYFVAVFVNVSQRKREEKALIQSEEKFRELFDNAPVGYHELDIDGVITNVNRTELDMLGYSRSEMVGWPVWNFISDREAAKERVLAKLAGNALPGSNVERSYIRKDGTVLPVLVDERFLFDEHKTIVGIRTILQDITVHKKTEHTLRTLQSAVEQTDEVVFTTGIDGTITFVNPAFRRLYGYTAEEVLGKTPRLLKSGCQDKPFYEALWTQVLAGNSFKDEIINKTRDGVLVTIESAINPLVDNEGKITGFVAVQKDITERKKDERERRKLQSQLFQMQKLESLGTLAGGIAHDFNNILGIILAYVSILQREYPSREILASGLDVITNAVQRGSSLVKQILTFARKSDVQPGPVNVNDSIKELHRMLAETFPKSLELRLMLDRTLPVVLIDTGQLHQALLNLCVNARDALLENRDQHNSVITVATTTISGGLLQKRFREASDGLYVSITVADNGPGMDEATRQRVFEPFFTTKSKGRGTGLGLSVVYGVVKTHEGFIDVQSEPGKGATFTLYLPVPREQTSSFTATEDASHEAPGGTETILVIEDEDYLRRMLVTILKNAGYEVFSARDGMEAIEVFD